MTSISKNNNQRSTKFVSQSARPGIIAEKIGMTSYFAEKGEMIPVSVLKVLDSKAISRKTQESHGYDAVVFGYNEVDAKKLSKPMKGYFEKISLGFFAKVKEFRVGEKCEINPGDTFSVNHFEVGQFVDISGVSIGKGFAGVMKRWNFRGLEASHGVSVSHRSHGSTGQRQDPGKVFKGKKMAGRLGMENVKLQNLLIVGIDHIEKVILVRGGVPGSKGSKVVITDAKKKLKIS
jgi:large subunit ribosomal protein L3